MNHRIVLSRMGLLAGLAGLMACGGSSGPKVAAEPAATSPEQGFKLFMKAVADSNVNQMAQYWGTPSGPALETNNPSDWSKRVVVMQAYLAPNKYRVVAVAPADPDADRRTLDVELTRDQTCVRVVPFGMVRTKKGYWIVNQFDLVLVGNPDKQCEQPGQGSPNNLQN